MAPELASYKLCSSASDRLEFNFRNLISAPAPPFSGTRAEISSILKCRLH